MRKFSTLCWMPILLVTLLPAAAQNPPPPDPLQGHIFPPELVMQNQLALGITEEQRDYLLDEIQQVQKESTRLQWKLQGEMEKMADLLSSETVDEQAALRQLQDILEMERQIKTAHMRLAIRIKNTLTPEQQTKLSEMRRHGPPPDRR